MTCKTPILAQKMLHMPDSGPHSHREFRKLEENSLQHACMIKKQALHIW